VALAGPRAEDQQQAGVLGGMESAAIIYPGFEPDLEVLTRTER
jgi:hypothetical protein